MKDVVVPTHEALLVDLVQRAKAECGRHGWGAAADEGYKLRCNAKYTRRGVVRITWETDGYPASVNGVRSWMRLSDRERTVYAVNGPDGPLLDEAGNEVFRYRADEEPPCEGESSGEAAVPLR